MPLFLSASSSLLPRVETAAAAAATAAGRKTLSESVVSQKSKVCANELLLADSRDQIRLAALPKERAVTGCRSLGRETAGVAAKSRLSCGLWVPLSRFRSLSRSLSLCWLGVSFANSRRLPRASTHCHLSSPTRGTSAATTHTHPHTPVHAVPTRLPHTHRTHTHSLSLSLVDHPSVGSSSVS